MDTNCWDCTLLLSKEPGAIGGPACQRLIDKGLSVFGAAGPKHWHTNAILTRPYFARGILWKNAVKIEEDLLKLPLGEATLSKIFSIVALPLSRY